MHLEWIQAGLGGTLIGVAVSLLLWWNGRVAGISGILYGLVQPSRGDRAWRASFLTGLVAGGMTLEAFRPSVFETAGSASMWTAPVAGILVGFGTVLGSGCTSGHGVCGVSRLSTRSIVATALFLASGIMARFLLKTLGGLP